MKKRFAVLGALLAATSSISSAQSSITVSGLVDVYAGSLRYSGDAARRTVLANGGMTTSWFGFNGVEDLGGGLKAEFAVQGFFLADTGASGRFANDNLFSRNSYIALSGGFGKLTLGRTSAPSFLPAVLFNPFGDSLQFSPLMLHTYVPTGPVGNRNWTASVAGDSGWSNQVQYSTPNVNGFQANVYYQPGEVSNTGAKNYALNGYYTRGPLGLTAAYHSVRASNPNPGAAILDGTAAPVNFGSIHQQTGYFVGARYDFQVLKAFATYRHNNNEAAGRREMDDHTYSLGMSIPVSAAGAVLAGYADTERSGSLLNGDRDRRTMTLGYDHKLSVRTDVYAMYMSDRLSTARREVSVGVGVRHRF